MNKIRTRIAGAMALCALFSCAMTEARASFITSAAELLGTPTVVDFNQFTDPLGTGSPITTAIEVASGVTWEASLDGETIGGGVIGTGFYDLDINGFWDSGRGGYTALAEQPGSMTYRFLDGPVSGVGAFLNFVRIRIPFTLFVEVLGESDTVLYSTDIAVNPATEIDTTGGVNAGGFRGYQLDTASIHAFRVRGQIIVLDDLTFTREVPGNVIPEPSTAVMAGVGLATVASVLRLRRRRQSAS